MIVKADLSPLQSNTQKPKIGQSTLRDGEGGRSLWEELMTLNPNKPWKNIRLPGPVIWYGGKGSHMLPKLLKLIPNGQTYVEPYGGAGSVIFTKPPSEVEIYNDLDPRLVNLMQVMKDPDLIEKFYHKVFFTLYSFEEFKTALDLVKSKGGSPLEQAWAFFVSQNQSYGGIAISAGNWGKALTADVGVAKKVRTYTLRVDRIARFHDRLQNIDILNEDAISVIEEFDGPDTVFYLDPPYAPDSRVNKTVYSVDQDLQHHQNLVSLLSEVTGSVVLSGYDHWAYDPLEATGWQKIELRSYSSAAARNRNSKTRGAGSLLKHVPRTEVIWRSPRAVDKCPLFESKSRIIKL